MTSVVCSPSTVWASTSRWCVSTMMVVVSSQMLPIAAIDPPFTEYFRTPHGLSFAAAAQLFDLSYENVTSQEFRSVFTPPASGDGGRLIEVTLGAAVTHTERDAAVDAIGRTPR